MHKANGFQNEYLFVLPEAFLARLADDALFSFLTVTDIGYFPRARYHFRQRPQGCETAILMYCSAGSGFYSIDGGKKKKLEAKQLIIIPPNTPHVYGASDENPWSIYWIHMKGFFLRSFYRRLSQYLPIKITDVVGEEFRELFKRCFTLLKTPYQEEEYFFLCQLAGTITALTLYAKKESDLYFSGESSRRLDKAFKYMTEHLHEKVSLKEITKAANLSSSRLHNLFHRMTGYPPIEYFLRSKIQAASKDLYFSRMPIKDIAAVYGIDDPYYFSRLFKKIMGVSPLEYRSQIKG
jgi:AraC-like DNA-binding protein